MSEYIRQGQTILDFAVRFLGSFEQVVELSLLNDCSATERLEVGTPLEIPAALNRQDIVDYLTFKKAMPATGDNIIVARPPEGIGFWIIENNFIVS